MRRREFLTLVGTTAAAWPLAARAQKTAKLSRIAVVSPTLTIAQMSQPGSNANWDAFFAELHRAGIVEGTNAVIDRYSGNSEPNTYADVTQGAVARNPDIIFIGGSAPMSQAAVAATKTIPIVFVTAEVTAYGIVSNYNHPGGNATGVDTQPATIEGKRMQLLHEAVPNAHRIACIGSAAGWEVFGQELADAATRLGLELVGPVIAAAPITETSYRDMFAMLLSQQIETIQLINSPENTTFGGVIGSMAARARLPGISHQPPFVDGGGLMTYGPDTAMLYGSAADYIALILNGAKPGDLPVIQPESYEFIVNLSAAKDLGLVLPQTIIASATELRQ